MYITTLLRPSPHIKNKQQRQQATTSHRHEAEKGPKGPKTTKKRPRIAPAGNTVGVRDALWPIGRARNSVRAPRHPATHPPTPFWAIYGRFGRQRAEAKKWPHLGLDGPNREGNREGTLLGCNPLVLVVSTTRNGPNGRLGPHTRPWGRGTLPRGGGRAPPPPQGPPPPPRVGRISG